MVFPGFCFLVDFPPELYICINGHIIISLFIKLQYITIHIIDIVLIIIIQAGNLQVRFLMVSLEFFIDIIVPVAPWLTQPLIEMITRNISWGD